MHLLFRYCLVLSCTALSLTQPMTAAAQPAPAVGVVVMHGKGGNPNRHVIDLANGLERRGYLVANLEMPWSGRRDYNADVAAAEVEVTAALNELRGRGAKKVFVAGHSQGGVFALYYASKNPVDGVIPVAPGGNVANATYAQHVGSAVAQARRMVAEGKGAERGAFLDYEGSRGTSTVHTTAAIYLSWFDPEGAMNQEKSSRAMPPGLPVLFIAPRNDYPGLQRVKEAMYGALPANPLTRLYEPGSDHLSAPRASVDEILRWTGEVVAR